MIRLNDGKPWFRRWMWIGAKPIAPEGKLTQLLTAAGGGLFGLLAFSFREETWLSLLFFAVGGVIVGTGAIVIALKTDR